MTSPIRKEFEEALNEQMWVGANKDNPEYEVAIFSVSWAFNKCADIVDEYGSPLADRLRQLSKELSQ